MGSSTAECSRAVVIICFPLRRLNSTAAWMAQLSPSVPQEVKKTSAGVQPRAAATAARSSLRRAAAACPSG